MEKTKKPLGRRELYRRTADESNESMGEVSKILRNALRIMDDELTDEQIVRLVRQK